VDRSCKVSVDGPAVGVVDVVVGAKERLVGATTAAGRIDDVDRMSSCRVVMLADGGEGTKDDATRLSSTLDVRKLLPRSEIENGGD
jgi:hypothetical protein